MILVVSNMYPSKKYPNYGVFVKNFVEQLQKTNEVKVITLYKQENMFLKFFCYLKFYLKVFFACISKKYTLTYVHYAGYNSPPLILGKIFNKKMKLIVNVHGSDVTPEKKLEERTNFLTGILLKKSDLVVVPSEYFESLVKKKYGVDNLFISPSAGINLSLFHRNTKIMREKNAFKLGYVSRIDAEKGWDILLLAFKDLLDEFPNMKLIMVGGGKQEAAAIQMIDKLELKNEVTKIHMLCQKDLVDIYSSIDIFIFPSVRAGESLGLVGLEAMACGTPVIGSDFGGIRTYVKNGENGYLYDPNNLNELKEAIKKYYFLNSFEKQKMKTKALETAKTYDSVEVNKKLIKKINEVIVG